MASNTVSQSQIEARDVLAMISLALINPQGPIPVVSLLAQSLEATKAFLPSELLYTIDGILDGCAQAERRN